VKILKISKSNSIGGALYITSEENSKKNVSLVRQNGFDPAFFFKAEKSKKLSVFWFNKMVLTQQFFVQKCRFRLTK
jgi:hypothetical protein